MAGTVYPVSAKVIIDQRGEEPHPFIRWGGTGICAVHHCPTDSMAGISAEDDSEEAIGKRWGHPIHTNRFATPAKQDSGYDANGKWFCTTHVAADHCTSPLTHASLLGALSMPLNPVPASGGGGSRVPIYIDPDVRAALHNHLLSAYVGTGVGYSEWIRRALTWDQAHGVPDQVQPDARWSGTYHPNDITALDEETQK